MKIVPLCENNDFRRAYRQGKSYVSPVCVCYVRKNRLSVTRVGITTSKKIGNAVTRSRARRVIREGMRELYPSVKEGFDIVIVARGRTPSSKSCRVRDEIKKQLGTAGILKNFQNKPAGADRA